MITVRYQPPKIDARVLVAAGASAGVEIAGKLILSASQPLVPVDSGDLKASGKVEVVGHRATISYEAESPEGYNYALRQHEDTALAHPRGGEDHYLSKPLASEGHALLGEMAAAMRAVL